MSNRSSIYEGPFEVTRTEYFNTDYPSIAHYFRKPSFFQDLIERDRFVIFGTRGTGKTMILKSIYLPVYLELLKRDGVDPKNQKHKFIGIYIPCDNLEFRRYFDVKYTKYFDHDEDKAKILWKRYFEHYFALYVVDNIFSTLWNYGQEIDSEIKERLNKLVSLILEIYDPAGALKTKSKNFVELRSFLNQERQRFLDFVDKKIRGFKEEFNIIKGLNFIKDICNLLGENIDSLKDIRFYLLLDDFFRHSYHLNNRN